jgi:hypothetical protein
VNARTISWLLGAAVAVYLLFVAARAWALIASGDPVPMLLGVSVIVIPVIGAWMLVRELGFGFRTQELGRILAREGGLPLDDLPRTPSGRIQRDAADARFVECQQDVERNPEDWRRWFRLAIAYDDARDRRRAREAMRTAIRLHRQLPDAG